MIAPVKRGTKAVRVNLFRNGERYAVALRTKRKRMGMDLLNTVAMIKGARRPPRFGLPSELFLGILSRQSIEPPGRNALVGRF
jgi:hypothetical protein